MFARFRPIRPYLARYNKRFVVGFACLTAGQSIGATAFFPLASHFVAQGLRHFAA